MPPDLPPPVLPQFKLARIIGVLASVLFIFLVENIWLDPWLRGKSHRIPSLVPAPVSVSWYLAFAILGTMLTTLVMLQTLLIRDRALPAWTRVWTMFTVSLVLILGAQWFKVTNGQAALRHLQSAAKKHYVTLNWKASTSPVAGYNVYRSSIPGGAYLKINSSLVRELTYTDNDVQSGKTYFYVTRAVDPQGHESINSNETTVVIP
jgi:hypothetical protein